MNTVNITYRIILRYGELCIESGLNFLVYPVNLLICKQENSNLKKSCIATPQLNSFLLSDSLRLMHYHVRDEINPTNISGLLLLPRLRSKH
jgi:hypothetical protein